MKSIAIFNNKGGVGKTTLLCNLAAYLSRHRDKRILVIDADPQCNATQSLFKDSVIERLYTNKHSFTINSIIHPLSLGKGYTEDIQPQKSVSFGVDVIPGDPRLALKEDLLASDWSDAIAGKPRGLRTTFVFSQLLELCTPYDFVLFDVGPSLGSINRAVLVASDYFISPMSTDIFSVKAIENITEAMSTWKKELEIGLQHNPNPEEVPAGMRGWQIRFAGYVTQQYYAKKDATGRTRAVGAYEKIMKRIPSTIEKNFLKKLQPNAQMLDYDLGAVPNLFSLIPMSQSSRKPIFDLKAADGVVGAHFTKVKEASGIFKHISDRLIENITSLNHTQRRR